MGLGPNIVHTIFTRIWKNSSDQYIQAIEDYRLLMIIIQHVIWKKVHFIVTNQTPFKLHKVVDPFNSVYHNNIEIYFIA